MCTQLLFVEKTIRKDFPMDKEQTERKVYEKAQSSNSLQFSLIQTSCH